MRIFTLNHWASAESGPTLRKVSRFLEMTLISGISPETYCPMAVAEKTRVCAS